MSVQKRVPHFAMYKHICNLAFYCLLEAGLMAAPAFLGAADQDRWSLTQDSKLWLEGTSTLHPYQAKATQIRLVLEDDGSQAVGTPEAAFALIKKVGIKKLEVSVPVKRLKSGESQLDKNMYRTLGADQVPEIGFKMESYQVYPSTNDKAVLTIEAKGRLSIAGQAKDVILNAVASVDQGTIHITGSRDLLMTDYGIKPPALMMGMLKVGDRVIVGYDLRLDFDGTKK